MECFSSVVAEDSAAALELISVDAENTGMDIRSSDMNRAILSEGA
jgi:hypothetical protein